MRTQPLIPGRRVSFAEMFPTVEEFTCEVDDRFAGETRVSRTPTTYTGSTFPEVIPCAKGCRNGGLDLRFTVEHLIENKEEEYDHSFLCAGRKGRGRGIECNNSIDVKILIRYKKEHPPT